MDRVAIARARLAMEVLVAIPGSSPELKYEDAWHEAIHSVQKLMRTIEAKTKERKKSA